MIVRRPQQFVAGSVVLTLLSVVVLAAASVLSAATVVVGAVAAVLVATEATAPRTVRPKWRRRLRIGLVGALFVFAVVVGQRAIELWPSGL